MGLKFILNFTLYTKSCRWLNQTHTKTNSSLGGLHAHQTPQIVLLTFDDAVNDINKDIYNDIFSRGRTNPNGCPITATFYVSHEWTDYSHVQNLYADGHEMASHTVS